MGWAAIDNLHQVFNNKPKKAFEKGRKVYGTWMEDAPVSKNKTRKVETDFDELLEIRKKNAGKHYRRMKWVGLFTALGMILFLLVFLFSTIDRLG